MSAKLYRQVNQKQVFFSGGKDQIELPYTISRPTKFELLKLFCERINRSVSYNSNPRSFPLGDILSV